MPNWCQNSIVIPTHAVKNFKRKFCSQTLNKSTGRVRHYLDFNRIIRQPVGIFKGDIGYAERKKYPLNWYDWNTDNWGTKWNACQTEFHLIENGLFTQITFDTAWNPPVDEMFYRMTKRLRIATLEHSWLEEGCYLWGTNEYEGCDVPEDDPFAVNGVYKNEMDETEEQYRYVVERFYGASEYADELVARFNGTWADEDEGEGQAA